MAKRTRHTWTRQETLAFLDAYAARKDEFQHSMRKKNAMQNVLEDLVSKGIFREAITVETLNIKIKNLTQAYKLAKDAAKQTGAGRVDCPFEEEMDAIFGNRPIISNAVTLTLNGQKTVALQEKPKTLEKHSPFQEANLNFENVVVKKEPLSPIEKKKKLDLAGFRKQKLDVYKEYLATKLELKRKGEESKEKRHMEKMELLKAAVNK